MVGAPHSNVLHTGIEQYQRTGVFINSTSKALTVRTAGTQFSIPAGKAATVPVGQDIYLDAKGKGAITWTVTSAVLAAQVQDAPHVQEQDEAAGSQVLEHPGATLLLSSGSYTKLVLVNQTKLFDA